MSWLVYAERVSSIAKRMSIFCALAFRRTRAGRPADDLSILSLQPPTRPDKYPKEFRCCSSVRWTGRTGFQSSTELKISNLNKFD